MNNQDIINAIELSKKEIAPIVKKSEGLKIKNKEDFTLAATQLGAVTQAIKQLKERKEAITKPLSEVLKQVKALFAPLELKLDNLSETLRFDMETFAREEAMKMLAKEAEIVAKVKSPDDFEKATNRINALQEKSVSKGVETEKGKTEFFTHRFIEVVDKSKVPLDYMVVDLPKARADMFAGKQIPGLKIVEEKRIKVTA